MLTMEYTINDHNGSPSILSLFSNSDKTGITKYLMDNASSWILNFGPAEIFTTPPRHLPL